MSTARSQIAVKTHRITKVIFCDAHRTALWSRLNLNSLKSRDSHRGGLRKHIASQTCIARLGEHSYKIWENVRLSARKPSWSVTPSVIVHPQFTCVFGSSVLWKLGRAGTFRPDWALLGRRLRHTVFQSKAGAGFSGRIRVNREGSTMISYDLFGSVCLCLCLCLSLSLSIYIYIYCVCVCLSLYIYIYACPSPPPHLMVQS